MDPFPFTSAEWSAIQQKAADLTNAVVYAEDANLAASARESLFKQLDLLKGIYGEHPVLVETRADFEDDPHEQIKLYRRAIVLTEQHTLGSLSIRLSLAGVYNDLREHRKAQDQLRQCEGEASDSNDESDVYAWKEAARKCGLLPHA